MQLFSGWIKGIKEPLGNSSLEDWASYIPENFPGEPMPPLSRLSRLDFFMLSLHTAPGLVALSILWVLFLLVAVFASILLISWEMRLSATPPSSMGALLSENDLGGSEGRRPFLCQYPQCDEWSNTFAAGRSSLKFEIREGEDYDPNTYRHST